MFQITTRISHEMPYLYRPTKNLA